MFVFLTQRRGCLPRTPRVFLRKRSRGGMEVYHQDRITIFASADGDITTVCSSVTAHCTLIIQVRIDHYIRSPACHLRLGIKPQDGGAMSLAQHIGRARVYIDQVAALRSVLGLRRAPHLARIGLQINKSTRAKQASLLLHQRIIQILGHRCQFYRRIAPPLPQVGRRQPIRHHRQITSRNSAQGVSVRHY